MTKGAVAGGRQARPRANPHVCRRPASRQNRADPKASPEGRIHEPKVAKDELKTGTFHAMCAQLGIKPNDL